MEEDIAKFSARQVGEVQIINRELTEKALHMRCLSYLSQVKAQLLTATIFEIDNSKKILLKVNKEISEQGETIQKQKAELEEKNHQLEALQKELEKRVDARTTELNRANEKLSNEITEHKLVENEKAQLQEQFLQAQKMESLGRLTGGVAHDFNNLLSAILGYSQLALRKLQPNDPLTRDLELIYSAGEKAATLTRQLLAFSRKQALDMRQINLNGIIENMTKILERMVGEDMVIELYTNNNVSCVKADIGQIEQVLMNLVVNARDAMPNGGKIVIETQNVLLDKDYSKLHDDVKPGEYVMLAVTDTGQGMSEKVQEKIFEPFFTTKEEGKGTGLGLATIHGIVKQHGGHIFVYSELGKGTTFKLFFEALDKVGVASAVKADVTMPRGSETILVVDDEKSIRKLIIDTLQPLGYQVLEASSGKEALLIGDNAKNKIDLLLTDVVMSEINGLSLIKMFKEKFPHTKAILMSGYTDKIISESDLFGGDIQFLQKPFTPSLLVGNIRKVCDAATKLAG